MGCPLFRGCLSIEVNGMAVGTFRIVCYIVGVCYSGVSVKRGSTVCDIVFHRERQGRRLHRQFSSGFQLPHLSYVSNTAVSSELNMVYDTSVLTVLHFRTKCSFSSCDDGATGETSENGQFIDNTTSKPCFTGY